MASRRKSNQRKFVSGISREGGEAPHRTGRWKARLGAPKAITAMAHKLARVLWHLLKFKQAFDWKVFEKEEQKLKRQKLARLQNLAASLNYQLVPNQ